MGDHCQSFEDLLFEPKEALSEAELARLAEHIEACEACRAERELFLESWDALEELQALPSEPPQVRARVWEQIRAEERELLESPPPLLSAQTSQRLSLGLQKLAVAGVALMLGLGLGKGLRHQTTPTPVVAESTSKEQRSKDFIDRDLIELASQEGYSVEIFPESTDFSPIDQEMMSALAPTPKDKTWIQKRRGAVIPVQYISQGGKAP